MSVPPSLSITTTTTTTTTTTHHYEILAMLGYRTVRTGGGPGKSELGKLSSPVAQASDPVPFTTVFTSLLQSKSSDTLLPVGSPKILGKNPYRPVSA